MAGGRRPANYAASLRHTNGAQRGPYERPTSPTALATGHSLPLWPASIWQPSPPTDLSTSAAISTSAPLSQSTPPDPVTPLTFEQPRYPSQERASALAQVLESTIETAVARHFAGTANSSNDYTSSTFDLVSSALPTAPPPIPPAPPLSSIGVPLEPIRPQHRNDSNGSLREEQLIDLVQRLEQKLGEKDNQLSEMNRRLERMEQLYQEQLQTNQQQYETLQKEFSSKLELMQNTIDSRQKWFGELHNQIQANENSIAKLKAVHKKSEQEKEAHMKKKISDEMRKITDHVNSHLNDARKRIDKTEVDCNQFKDSLTDMQKSRKSEISDMRKNLNAHGNQTATVQAHVKKIESQLANLSHKVTNGGNDMGSMKNRMKELEGHVSRLSKLEEEQRETNNKHYETISQRIEVVSELVDSIRSDKEEIANKQLTTDMDENVSGHLKDRVQTLENSTKGLKKLVETNLRAHCDAEDIVKKQVSLITKHVCVAMRQFTSRRINENNILLDKALRARIPEYAKNQDRFVLVREEETEGNDNVQVKRIVEVSTKAGS